MVPTVVNRRVWGAAVSLALAVTTLGAAAGPADAFCAAGAGASRQFCVTTPSAPAITLVTPGDSRLVVAWDAPVSDGGSPVIGYQLRTTFEAAVISSQNLGDVDLSSVDHLVNGVSYELRVAAVSADGQGPWSDPVTGTPQQNPALVETTDVATRIHVGSAVVALPISVTLSDPRETVEVELAHGADPLASVTLAGDTATRTFQGQLRLRAADVTAWGDHQWQFTPAQPGTPTLLPASIRLHTLLGLSVLRDGDAVLLTASARAYHSVLDSYRPWNARPIAVQRWTKEGWTTIRTLTTDAAGNAEANLRIPFTVGIRLSTPDAAWFWGATTAQQVL